MKLAPLRKQSLSDTVFEHLTGEIVSGELEPGTTLPSERALTEGLGVNRGAIREAVKRLSQAGLVRSQHGSGHTVLDYRRTAALDLLPRLLCRDGDIDPKVVRSVMELRSVIGPDAARLCAERSPEVAEQLRELAGELMPSRPLAELQEIAVQFWDVVVEGSDNIAYRLAYNSLRMIYDDVREAVAEVLADELRDQQAYQSIAEAIGHKSGFSANCEAAALMERGLDSLNAAFSALDNLGGN